MNIGQVEYPRLMTMQERELLSAILPEERHGYREYREQLFSMVAIGEGRRGTGEIIFGQAHDKPDFDEPLAPVFAYGVIETSFGNISVTAREPLMQQISVEIVNNRGEHVPEVLEESRRWTYSTWLPGKPCPQCVSHIREVAIQTDAQQALTLVFCRQDKRIWVYEADSQVVRLIPVTNFYNELMLYKNIRDPKIALDSKLLFTSLDSYSDADLTHAFFTYNKLKTKVQIKGTIQQETKRAPGIFSSLKRLFASS